MKDKKVNIDEEFQQFNVGDTFWIRLPFHAMVDHYKVVESFVGWPPYNLDKLKKIGERDSHWC